MDIAKITEAQTVANLTTQISALQQQLKEAKAQLDALGLTSDEVATALQLYQAVKQIVG